MDWTVGATTELIVYAMLYVIALNIAIKPVDACVAVNGSVMESLPAVPALTLSAVGINSAVSVIGLYEVTVETLEVNIAVTE